MKKISPWKRWWYPSIAMALLGFGVITLFSGASGILAYAGFLSLIVGIVGIFALRSSDADDDDDIDTWARKRPPREPDSDQWRPDDPKFN